jgi:hypothetical protein
MSAKLATVSSVRKKFSSCSLQVAQYGLCVQNLSQEVETNSCQKEFESLRACFAKKKS